MTADQGDLVERIRYCILFANLMRPQYKFERKGSVSAAGVSLGSSRWKNRADDKYFDAGDGMAIFCGRRQNATALPADEEPFQAFAPGTIQRANALSAKQAVTSRTPALSVGIYSVLSWKPMAYRVNEKNLQ